MKTYPVNTITVYGGLKKITLKMNLLIISILSSQHPDCDDHGKEDLLVLGRAINQCDVDVGYGLANDKDEIIGPELEHRHGRRVVADPESPLREVVAEVAVLVDPRPTENQEQKPCLYQDPWR